MTFLVPNPQYISRADDLCALFIDTRRVVGRPVQFCRSHRLPIFFDHL
jgi:hypothetical protein